MSAVKQPSDFFLFDFPSAEDDGHVDAVCFTPTAEIDTALLIEALERHIGSSSMAPARLLLIAPEPALDQARAVAADERVADALPTFTRYTNTPQISPLLFGKDGTLSDPEGDVLPGEGDDYPERLLREGLRWIFRVRRGMLRTGPGYHYVNPSGRHTKGFIRTGNVLLHSAEIAFIAMATLKWWPSDLRRIFVDTASISSVAYALIALRKMFEPDLTPPTIDSFSSYGGMRDFAFTADQALCLISATTSGGLERKIIEKGHLPSERVVTLFYCGPKPRVEARIVCDVTQREDQPGEERPRSFDSAEECDMCRRGSTTIHISGDQFLPADPDVGDLVLAAEHAPRWLPAFLKGVVGEGIVRCHGSTIGEPGRTREVYVQLNEALQQRNRDFAQALEHRLKTVVPASLAKIVYVEHPSSKALAEAVAAYFEKVSGKPLDPDFVLGAKRVLGREVDLKGLTGPVMVIAGAISSGRTLLGISQFLRNVSDVDSIVYLIGIARPDSPPDWDRLRSNLTYGQRPGAYPLETVAQAYLPTEQDLEQSPWATEWRFLLEVRERLEEEDKDPEALVAVDERRETIALAAAEGGAGLTDDVFLPRVQEGTLSFSQPSRLQLRPGFVFWRGLREGIETDASQADVYVTILSILHRLRSVEPEESALVQHAHNRTVLSPANFARFNDGVIQAALLRAARPRELDFSHDPNLSAQMRYMIRRFIEHMNDDEGEAAPEFLLAFAQGHLILTKPDQENVRAFLDDLPELPPFMRALKAQVMASAPPGRIEDREQPALAST